MEGVHHRAWLEKVAAIQGTWRNNARQTTSASQFLQDLPDHTARAMLEEGPPSEVVEEPAKPALEPAKSKGRPKKADPNPIDL